MGSDARATETNGMAGSPEIMEAIPSIWSGGWCMDQEVCAPISASFRKLRLTGGSGPDKRGTGRGWFLDGFAYHA
jgi:hypothetical protein